MVIGKESAYQCRRRGFSPWMGKIPWRRAWQPSPELLPGESRGQRSLAGYSPWGHKELDTTETTEHAHTHSQGVINLSSLCTKEDREPAPLRGSGSETVSSSCEPPAVLKLSHDASCKVLQAPRAPAGKMMTPALMAESENLPSLRKQQTVPGRFRRTSRLCLFNSS